MGWACKPSSREQRHSSLSSLPEQPVNLPSATHLPPTRPIITCHPPGFVRLAAVCPRWQRQFEQEVRSMRSDAAGLRRLAAQILWRAAQALLLATQQAAESLAKGSGKDRIQGGSELGLKTAVMHPSHPRSI